MKNVKTSFNNKKVRREQIATYSGGRTATIHVASNPKQVSTKVSTYPKLKPRCTKLFNKKDGGVKI